MAKADSVHSTPPTNTSKISRDRTLIPGRRAFLSGVAALSVAAGPAITLSPDPIFAVIEAHKAARAMWVANVYRHSDLEKELPKDKRRSFVHVDRDELFETDDPRWIECEREVMRTFDLETGAACILVSIVPTSQAGVVAYCNMPCLRILTARAGPASLFRMTAPKSGHGTIF